MNKSKISLKAMLSFGIDVYDKLLASMSKLHNIILL